MSDTLIKAEGVSKKFCSSMKRSMFYGMADIATDTFNFNTNSELLRKDEFWAVENVSFELKRGECLGVIGRNGAGKSTLLKMLNGIFLPDKGKITIKGKVGALIEVGAGFHPMLTGRENIYINAAILGMKKRDVTKKLDEIIAFAELENFIDMPVKNYSSGMYVRLGFSIAMQIEPDVLLVDEALAVGDISFVIKCLNKVNALQKDMGMVFVSHNLPQVMRVSSKLLLLTSGKPTYQTNDMSAIINQFYSGLTMDKGASTLSDMAKLISIQLKSKHKESQNDEIFCIEYNQELRISLQLEIDRSINSPHVYFSFLDREQRNFAEIYSSSNEFVIENKKKTIEVEAALERVEFSQGVYSINFGLTNKKGGEILLRYQSVIYFQVINGVHGWAPMQLNPKWIQHN